MAGLGFKDFAVGEVLTAADVDGYLMQQTVMRFADAGARGSALGTAVLAEGMVSYLDDVNQLQFYNGSIWREAGRVVQVTSNILTTPFTTSSTSFQDVVTVDITPTSASNNILLMSMGMGGNAAGNFMRLNLSRGTTDIVQSTSAPTADQTMFTVGVDQDPFTLVGTDAPATTSTVNYRLRAASSSGTIYIGRRLAADDYRSATTIVAIEYVP